MESIKATLDKFFMLKKRMREQDIQELEKDNNKSLVTLVKYNQKPKDKVLFNTINNKTLSEFQSKPLIPSITPDQFQTFQSHQQNTLQSQYSPINQNSFKEYNKKKYKKNKPNIPIQQKPRESERVDLITIAFAPKTAKQLQNNIQLNSTQHDKENQKQQEELNNNTKKEEYDLKMNKKGNDLDSDESDSSNGSLLDDDTPNISTKHKDNIQDANKVISNCNSNNNNNNIVKTPKNKESNNEMKMNNSDDIFDCPDIMDDSISSSSGKREESSSDRKSIEEEKIEKDGDDNKMVIDKEEEKEKEKYIDENNFASNKIIRIDLEDGEIKDKENENKNEDILNIKESKNTEVKKDNEKLPQKIKDKIDSEIDKTPNLIKNTQIKTISPYSNNFDKPSKKKSNVKEERKLKDDILALKQKDKDKDKAKERERERESKKKEKEKEGEKKKDDINKTNLKNDIPPKSTNKLIIDDEEEEKLIQKKVDIKQNISHDNQILPENKQRVQINEISKEQIKKPRQYNPLVKIQGTRVKFPLDSNMFPIKHKNPDKQNNQSTNNTSIRKSPIEPSHHINPLKRHLSLPKSQSKSKSVSQRNSENSKDNTIKQKSKQIENKQINTQNTTTMQSNNNIHSKPNKIISSPTDQHTLKNTINANNSNNNNSDVKSIFNKEFDLHCVSSLESLLPKINSLYLENNKSLILQKKEDALQSKKELEKAITLNASLSKVEEDKRLNTIIFKTMKILSIVLGVIDKDKNNRDAYLSKVFELLDLLHSLQRSAKSVILIKKNSVPKWFSILKLSFKYTYSLFKIKKYDTNAIKNLIEQNEAESLAQFAKVYKSFCKSVRKLKAFLQEQKELDSNSDKTAEECETLINYLEYNPHSLKESKCFKQCKRIISFVIDCFKKK